MKCRNIFSCFFIMSALELYNLHNFMEVNIYKKKNILHSFPFLSIAYELMKH